MIQKPFCDLTNYKPANTLTTAPKQVSTASIVRYFLSCFRSLWHVNSRELVNEGEWKKRLPLITVTAKANTNNVWSTHICFCFPPQVLLKNNNIKRNRLQLDKWFLISPWAIEIFLCHLPNGQIRRKALMRDWLSNQHLQP